MMSPKNDKQPKSFSKPIVGGVAALMLALTACSAESPTDSASSDSASSDSAATDSEFDAAGSASANDSAVADDSAMADEEAMAEPSAEGTRLGTAGVGADGTPVQNAALVPADVGRDIIRTAEIEVEVENVAEATNIAVTRIEGLGGLLFGQETTTNDIPRTQLVFKVQPADFSKALQRLSDVGSLRNQRISADDVTERVVNLESRIITSEASVERLRGFLEQATDLVTIADLESQLLVRETDLELLRGQLRTVQNQVSLATITVTLTQKVPGPALELEASAYFGHDGGATCAGDETIELDEFDPLTICYELTNSGDTYLVDIELSDPSFGLEAKDLDVSFGDLSEPLAPGETINLFAEVEADFSITARPQVSAAPAEADGSLLRFGAAAARDEVPVSVNPDTSVASFGEGLTAGWGALSKFISVLVLIAGVVLPWVWVFPLAFFGLRWNKARTAQKAAQKAELAAERSAQIPPPVSFQPGPSGSPR